MSFQGRIKLALILADIHDARYDNLLQRIMEAAKEELVPDEKDGPIGTALGSVLGMAEGFNAAIHEMKERIEKL